MMKKLLTLFTTAALAFTCCGMTGFAVPVSVSETAQQEMLTDFDTIAALLDAFFAENDLPVRETYADTEHGVYLIALFSAKDRTEVCTALIPFLEANNIPSTVISLALEILNPSDGTMTEEEYNAYHAMRIAFFTAIAQAEQEHGPICWNYSLENEEFYNPVRTVTKKITLHCFPQDQTIIEAALADALIPAGYYEIIPYTADDETLYQTGRQLAGFCETLCDAFADEREAEFDVYYDETRGQIAITSGYSFVTDYITPIVQAYAEANGIAADQYFVRRGAIEVIALLKGDAINDYQITATDAQKTLELAAEQIVGNNIIYASNIDIDGDKEITSLDAQYILMYYLKNTVLNDPTLWRDLLV